MQIWHVQNFILKEFTKSGSYKIQDALLAVLHRRELSSHQGVFLNIKMGWSGEMDTLLVDYWEQRTANCKGFTRKTLCAAVTRIYNGDKI